MILSNRPKNANSNKLYFSQKEFDISHINLDPHSKKPFAEKSITDFFEFKTSESFGPKLAFIGDRLSTDVHQAKRLGSLAIYVDPLSPRSEP